MCAVNLSLAPVAVFSCNIKHGAIMNPQQILFQLWSAGEIGFLIPRLGSQQVHIIRVSSDESFEIFRWPGGTPETKSLQETMAFISRNREHFMGL